MQPRSLSGLDDRDIVDILAGLARFAGALRGARILVTGATGWFGTWLLDALVAVDRAEQLGLSIVALSRDAAAFGRRHPHLHAAPAISWIEADVRASLLHLPGTYTHVIHAATDSTEALPSERMLETILHGTANVLALAACHPGVKVLIVSSGAVYGPQPSSLPGIPEDYAGAPNTLDAASAYAEGKRVAEVMAAIWHTTYGVHVTIARCFAFVGPHMPFDAHFAIGNFIRDAADGNAIRVNGNGSPRRSYLYMTDLVVWLLKILIEGRPVRPYNVGGAEALSVAALARKVAAFGKPAVPVAIVGESGGCDYVPDTTRIIEELHVTIEVALDQAIKRTFAWFESARCVGVPALTIEHAPC